MIVIVIVNQLKLKYKNVNSNIIYKSIRKNECNIAKGQKVMLSYY